MFRRAWIIGLAAMLIVGAVALPANASTGTADQFAAQASAAGLNAAQAAELQKRVDNYLARVGGTQVAANKISYADGNATLTLALPGETRARELGATQPASLPFYCGSGVICMWANTGYTGDEVTAFRCQVSVSIPFIGNGSYNNNQTPNTYAIFYGGSGQFIDHSCPASCRISTYNWTPIFSVVPC